MKPQNESKSIGSIYFNAKKGSNQETLDQLKKVLNWLRDSGVYLSISVKDATGFSGYRKFSAFPNSFKDSPKHPDMYIRESAVEQAKPADAPQQKSNLPF